MKKSAQTWSMDITVAFALFLMGIIVFYIYSINYTSEAADTINSLSYEGDLIFNSILTDPRPLDWDASNVVKLGITIDGKVNQTLLERFYYLALNDYGKTKTLFKSSYNYYFFFDSNVTINSTIVEGIGKPGVTKNNINSENLISITRFTIYNNQPRTVNLYIWGGD